jgi:hypothetical protein
MNLPVIIGTLGFFCANILFVNQLKTALPIQNSEKVEVFQDNISINKQKTRSKALELLQFCEENDYNTEIGILIDMSIHSGLKRLVMWDFKQDKITYSCLVSHGCCENPWGEDYSKNNPVFSNVNGSHCSSLGKYRLGERGYSNWGIGIKYLMHGLEESNRNALARQIVFHSWDDVPDNEAYPDGAPEGWGCPAISNESMEHIDKLLKNKKPEIIMWIYK